MESVARLCYPGRQSSCPDPRGKAGFSTFKSGCGRETDCLLEGDGFELPVPGCGVALPFGERSNYKVAQEAVSKSRLSFDCGRDTHYWAPPAVGNRKFESISLQQT